MTTLKSPRRQVKMKPSMGKKRAATRLGKKPSEIFAARLRSLLGDQSGSSLAKKLNISADAVLKWLRAERTPPLDDLPAIAAALGVSDWRELLD